MAKLSISDLDIALLNQLGYTADNFSKQNFSQSKLEQLYADVLTYYSNNGYPFAKVYLDSIELNNENITAHLAIKKRSIISY